MALQEGQRQLRTPREIPWKDYHALPTDFQTKMICMRKPVITPLYSALRTGGPQLFKGKSKNMALWKEV